MLFFRYLTKRHTNFSLSLKSQHESEKKNFYIDCLIDLHAFVGEEVVPRILYCGHVFTTGALETWFTENVRCPMCRYAIRNLYKIKIRRWLYICKLMCYGNSIIEN